MVSANPRNFKSLINPYLTYGIPKAFLKTNIENFDDDDGYEPGILFGRGGGGVLQIQLKTEDRENGELGTLAPLVRGSGGSCNLVQEISFQIVTFS